jgi:hypothetical protein
VVDKNKLDQVIGMVLLQEAGSGLDKKEKFLKDCLIELRDIRVKNEKNKTKEITLKIQCPECEEDMDSTANINFENDFSEINLYEFEGQDYECSCGYKTHILAVDARDMEGKQIY